MRALTYTGRAHVRTLGPDAGLDVRREFLRGVPLEVSDADAARILEGPAGAEFEAGPEYQQGGAEDDAPAKQAPQRGDRTDTEEE